MRARVPRPAGRAPAAGHRPRPGRRLPRARLTGLGCGVLAVVSMIAAAWFCELLGGAPTCYGVLFVVTAAAVSLWVRPADLICAPVAAPIAFAVGLLTTGGLLETVTDLALSAPWVFAGTMTACAITLTRSALQLIRRRASRRAAAAG
ncbi:DUF6542 domain-containing protein [Streptomyces hainanensis]|uniref:DUF6542 domain-containing protein n=1 Tax=Streptomyces hainanensis TaxID=402648 RepID=A0A4R4TPT3_9ACTN|nr:DUF6542 domain-containing protein [Streptomyces hainanensis]TDC76129.1 hypothetical protein E1283_10570 [Streptomyces hainanensis]